MAKIFSMILIVASATIFSCNHFEKHVEQMEGKDDEKSIIDDVDEIAYSYHPSSVAPKYYRGYTITVAANSLHLAINSYSDTLMTKDWDFSEKKFNDVKKRLKNLEEDGKIDDDKIAIGGTSQSIILYKNGKKILEGEDYRSTKNFSGADINLSYLIADLKELIAETEDNQE